jgi:hypothetical protein
VELVDLEPGRVSWRIRAGAKDAMLASPLRELSGEDGARVVLAATMGVAPEARARGLATDGRVAVPVRGGADYGVLVADNEGRLGIARGDALPDGSHADMAELPLLLWDGQRAAAAGSSVLARSAIGTTPSGRVLIARAPSGGGSALADALDRAGCTRALLLDRGAHATGMLDRAGTDHPPRAQYDQTVLYAIATTLRPRGFRFDPTTMVAEGPKPKR